MAGHPRLHAAQAGEAAKLTIRLSPPLSAAIETWRRERGLATVSEAVREMLDAADELRRETKSRGA